MGNERFHQFQWREFLSIAAPEHGSRGTIRAEAGMALSRPVRHRRHVRYGSTSAEDQGHIRT